MWPFSRQTRLPFPRGPYTPGCSDVMIGFGAASLFVRFYYPADGEKADLNEHKNQWIPWFPHVSYIKGLASVIFIPSFVLKIIMWFASGTLMVPVLYGSKIKTDIPLKCIVTSHGLGANRFFYSASCLELASRGFVIVVIEHKDQTSSHTYYYNCKEDAMRDKKTVIKYKNIPFGKEHQLTRSEQVLKRADECEKVLDLLLDLNAGKDISNVMDLVPSKYPKDFKLEDLKGNIDVESLIVMGHSFGGATGLVTLSRRPNVRLGIMLDPWMFPLKNLPNLPETIKQPTLFINTQTFHIKPNVDALMKFTDGMDEKRPMYTLLHSTHEHQTDSVYALGSWLNWFMRKLTPVQATLLNDSLILSFLNRHLGLDESIEDCERLLLNEKENYAMGITKAWA